MEACWVSPRLLGLRDVRGVVLHRRRRARRGRLRAWPSRPHRDRPQPSRGRSGLSDGLGRLPCGRALDPGAGLGLQADRRRRYPQSARGREARNRGDDRAADAASRRRRQPARRREPHGKSQRHVRRDPGPHRRLGDLLACLLQVQVAAADAGLGVDFRAFSYSTSARVPHRPAVRDAGLRQRHGRSAHHPARPAPARADPRHRGAGRGQRSGEEGPAAVPVRPPPLRIQGRADRGATGRGQAERRCAQGRRRHRDAEDGA